MLNANRALRCMPLTMRIAMPGGGIDYSDLFCPDISLDSAMTITFACSATVAAAVAVVLTLLV